MKSHAVTSLLRVTVMAAAVTPWMPASAQGAQDEWWQYELTPYLWAAGVDGHARLGPLSLDSSTSFSDILSNLDFAAMGAFEARKGRWGIVTDLMYIKLSDEGLGPRGRGELEVTQKLFGLGGAWRALEGGGPGARGAGLRYQSIKPRIELPAGSRERTKDAVDPFIGVRGTYPLDARWSLVGYADVGTYSGGDYAWQVAAGANYAFSDTRIIKFGYRRLKTKYSKDEFEIDTTLDGLYVGLGFRF
jgi:hypothetical protein